MELKWFLIAMVCWAGMMCIVGMYENYTDNQCRVAAIQANKTPTEIAEICK